MTSGSLFESSPGMAWSGKPDGVGPNALSSNGTDSSVFRLNTTRRDFGNVAVEFDLINNGLGTTSRTPAQTYDGVHVWVRYQSEYYLYAVSINRRDNTSVIKKKVAGGPSNGGTYYTLASAAHAVPYGARQHVKVTAQDNADGSTTIALYDNGALVLQAETEARAARRSAAWRLVGVRRANRDLHFTNFQVAHARRRGRSRAGAGSGSRARSGSRSQARDHRPRLPWAAAPASPSPTATRSAPPAPAPALTAPAVTSPGSGQTVGGRLPARQRAGAVTVQWQVDGVLGGPVPAPFTLNWYSKTASTTHAARRGQGRGRPHGDVGAGDDQADGGAARRGENAAQGGELGVLDGLAQELDDVGVGVGPRRRTPRSRS